MRTVSRSQAPDAFIAAAAPYEQHYGITFSRLCPLGQNELALLHSPHNPPDTRGRVHVASATDSTILDDFVHLTRIANTRGMLTPEERLAYTRKLVSILQRLDQGYLPPTTIAPRREGAYLADQVGWHGHTHHEPNAKRIPFGGGLLVGIDDLFIETAQHSYLLIDGAIASGATQIAILDCLKSNGKRVAIRVVHAALEGVWAILRVADKRGLDVDLAAGHITLGLNEKFYAVRKDKPTIVQVGDLGDIIFGTSPPPHRSP